MSDLYKSQVWLRKRYVEERKTPQQIADECKTSVQQVYRYLNTFNLRRK